MTDTGHTQEPDDLVARARAGLPGFLYIHERVLFGELIDCISAMQAAGKGVVAAGNRLMDMLSVHGDFRNGVTDSTGSVDEGEVRAGEIIHAARTALTLASEVFGG